MIVIVCLDDNCGMMFNKRRQSRDKEVYNRILQLIGNNKLWLNDYSRVLFGDDHTKIAVNSDFILKAKDGEYCFIENTDISEYSDKIEKIIVFKWNRVYPSDMKFAINLSAEWKLVEINEFKGNSHDKITEEVYIK